MSHKPFSVATQDNIISSSYDMRDNLLFNDATSFSHFVEMHAIDEGKTCTQIIIEYCDLKDIDPEDISKLVSHSLRGKIQAEMIDAGLLPAHTQLED